MFPNPSSTSKPPLHAAYCDSQAGWREKDLGAGIRWAISPETEGFLQLGLASRADCMQLLDPITAKAEEPLAC